MVELANAAVVESDALDAEFQKRMARACLTHRGRVASNYRGRRRAFGIGQGVDFADHRPYQRGDDLRHVDWKAYARSGRMLVRRFEPQGSARIAILLDCSASMGTVQGAKLRLSKRVAATLAHAALLQGDEVRVWALHGATLTATRLCRKLAQQGDVFDFLRGLQAAGKTDLAAAALAFSQQQQSRTITVLLSDLVDDEGYRSAVERLRASSQQCHVIHVCDAVEGRGVDLGSVELIDSESGARLRGTITSDIIARFRHNYEREMLHAAQYFNGRGIPYVRLSTAESIERAIIRMRHARLVEA